MARGANRTSCSPARRRIRLTFEDIDYVFCTHLHVDHVGWNTRLIDGRLTPAFPNAKYVFSKREFEHWKQAMEPGFAAVHEDCVQPIVDAGQALLVDDLRPVRRAVSNLHARPFARARLCQPVILW